MRQLLVDSNHQFYLHDAPVPVPGPGEVLIRVAASGVNRPDILQRKGNYPPPAGASPVVGLEVAGEIVGVGASSQRWHPGDSVCALLSGGGYAEYCTVPEIQCLPVPPGLSLVEAAALPENFFTVWNNVFQRGNLQAGESFLVHGGTSGIGTTAIQLARALGARVFATAGGESKCQACLSLGAEAPIDYKTKNFSDEIHRLVGGVDVILDMVGGDYFQPNLDCLQMDGRLIQIAALKGSRVELDLMSLMSRRITLTGSMLRPRSALEKGAIARSLEAKVWPLLAAGKVKPQIFKTFPLEQAGAAHDLMESSSHIGKIVLTQA